jgi:hypothetical protein
VRNSYSRGTLQLIFSYACLLDSLRLPGRGPLGSHSCWHRLQFHPLCVTYCNLSAFLVILVPAAAWSVACWLVMPVMVGKPCACEIMSMLCQRQCPCPARHLVPSDLAPRCMRGWSKFWCPVTLDIRLSSAGTAGGLSLLWCLHPCSCCCCCCCCCYCCCCTSTRCIGMPSYWSADAAICNHTVSTARNMSSGAAIASAAKGLIDPEFYQSSTNKCSKDGAAEPCRLAAVVSQPPAAGGCSHCTPQRHVFLLADPGHRQNAWGCCRLFCGEMPPLVSSHLVLYAMTPVTKFCCGAAVVDALSATVAVTGGCIGVCVYVVCVWTNGWKRRWSTA